MRELWNSLSQEMKPRFHEISTYLIACSFCWLLIFHPEFRNGVYMFFTGLGSMSPVFIVLGLIIAGGLLLSLIHPFIKRKKSPLEKAIMAWSVLAINVGVSFFVGVETIPLRSWILMILVVWNLLISIFLLFEMGAQKYEVSDEDASFVEVIVTTIILVAVLLLSDLCLHLSWASILSMCIFYSTSIVFITNWAINVFDLHIPFISK